MGFFKCVFLIPLLLASLAFFADADEQASRLPSLPCVQGRPRARWLPPCTPPPPQPAECYTSVSGLVPCADVLTSTGVPPRPTTACCDGLRSLVADAPICMCHVLNGDISRLLPAPMVRLRMVELPRMCGVGFPRVTLLSCISGPVPPMNPPPTPAATPPEAPSDPPAATPPESPSTPPAASSPPEPPSTPTPPAASPPESPSTPPPAASPPEESPSTPPPATSPAVAPPESSPSSPAPESPSTPPPTPAATPPESASSPATPPAPESSSAPSPSS